MRVRKSQVMSGTLTPIAKGGVGQVYRLTGASIAGLTGPLAYKEILPEVQGVARAEAVHAMEHTVMLREAMNAADRAELERITTWPLATVEENGATVGTLMPLIPREFFVTLTPQGQPPRDEVFAYAFLCVAESYMLKMGLDRSLANDPLVRLSLAAQLAYVIGLLHKHDIVYGDLSLQNVVISLGGQPNLMVIDCDAAAAISDKQRHQMHSPSFKPPENLSGVQKEQDLQTDVYKLGLCILRGLVTGPGVTQLTDARALASVLEAEGVDLVTRALSADRALRPTAKELCLYLVRAVNSRARPPVLHGARLNRRVMVRGQDVLVSWSGEALSKVRITGTNGLTEPVTDPGGHPHGYAITPATSGPIFVEATNRYGTVSAGAGYIDLYDLPEFELSKARLPRPQVPRLAPVQVPTALSALPARPIVTADSHRVPRISAPDLGPLYDSVHQRLMYDPLDRLVAAADGIARGIAGTGHETNELAVDLVGSLAATVQTAHEAMHDAMTQAMTGVSADLQRRLAEHPMDRTVDSQPSATRHPAHGKVDRVI
jgi:hypothetical protein